MRTEWLLRTAQRRVVVFFNGWGMDHAIARYLLAHTPEGFGYDLLSCYDYGDPRLADDTLAELGQYDERVVVAWSLGVWAAARSGIEKVDRSLAINGTLTPLDKHTILKSVEKTGRLLVADEGHKTCGVAAEISAMVAEEAIYNLKAPVLRVCSPDTPVPFSPPLEMAYIPDEKDLMPAVKRLMEYA